jgi:hypothetical protein
MQSMRLPSRRLLDVREGQPLESEFSAPTAERADGVPDADEVNVDLRVRVRASEQFGSDHARLAVPLWIAIERACLLDPLSVLGPPALHLDHRRVIPCF